MEQIGLSLDSKPQRFKSWYALYQVSYQGTQASEYLDSGNSRSSSSTSQVLFFSETALCSHESGKKKKENILNCKMTRLTASTCKSLKLSMYLLQAGQTHVVNMLFLSFMDRMIN